MIDIKCDRGRIEQHINGTLAELGADLLTMVHSVYTAIFEQDPLEGVEFKEVILSKMPEMFELDENDYAKMRERRMKNAENE